MKRLAGFILNRLIAGRDINVAEERARLGLIEGWTGMLGNLLLSLAKLSLGLLIGSVSLMADAAHTASDISSDVVILVSFKLSGKKPDRLHPFGHGRVEYLAGLAIAVLLIAAGLSFVFTAVDRIAAGTEIQRSIPALALTLFSIFFKQMMYYFSLQLGQKIDSEAILGNAWHHRSDALSSVAVLLALAGSYLGFHFLDAVFGLAVAGVVIYTGVGLAGKAVNRILGTGPNPEVKEAMLRCAREVEGVKDVHDLEVHDYGATKSATLHIEVEGSLSVAQAHEIADRVEQQVGRSFHCRTVVHLDPSPAKNESGRLNKD